MATTWSLHDRSVWTLVVLGLVAGSLPSAGAFDPLDPFGRVLIRWDIMGWTGDGYMATVNIVNTQQYRGLKSYQLGWKWTKQEVIWAMQGARAREQGDCTSVPTNPPPHSCSPNPQIIDLSRNITVGRSGNTNATINIPQDLRLESPGLGYTCSPLRNVIPTKFLFRDGMRSIQPYATWNATCTYSQYLANRAPTCCVSVSAYYSSQITPCANCACNCGPNTTAPGTHPLPGTDQTCVTPSSKNLRNILSNGRVERLSLFCTRDMCPVKIHWHVKKNNKQDWITTITITNRALWLNHSDWNLVIQHPNFASFTKTFSFKHKALTPYGDVRNDTALFYGVKHYNDVIMQAGSQGNVHSEIVFAKDSSFTLSHGWVFPSRVYFDGDDCVLPNPADYPALPSD